jgi:nucleotide-binding universal stress UspA family protein
VSLITAPSPELKSCPHRRVQQRLVPGALLVASNGDDASAACVRVAAAMARPLRIPVRVLTVVEPHAFETRNDPVWKNDNLRHRIDHASALVRRQIDGFRDELWSFDVAIGDRVEVISAELQRDDPPWLIIGLNSHTMLDRLLRRETTVPITRHAGAPVLGVTADAPSQFSSAVIGFDLSMPSRSAARAACGLLTRGGRAVLAYVHPFDERGDPASAFEETVMQSVTDSLARFAADLASQHDIEVEGLIVGGDPVEQLALVAEREKASLIALGALIEPPRVSPPRVRSGLQRIGRWPVLVVPSHASQRL